jgi:hydroxyacylglutathione hydrolase
MFEAICPGVYVLVSRSFDSNIGLIDGGKDKALVDTGTGIFHEGTRSALLKLGIGLEDITDILLTHSHVDHIGGISHIADEASPKIHLHKEEADLINAGDMQLTLADTFGAEIPQMNIEGVIQEGDIIDIGDFTLRVLHTPGHSAGSVCYHLENEGIVFTGDTMFSGGSFGRVDFPTGNPRKIVASLKRLSELSDFDVALPGHMDPVRENATRSAISSFTIARDWFDVDL